MAQRLYFIRHGESIANRLGIFSNRPPSYPLTAKGLTQAQALATRLQGLPVACIWASPLCRAQQTAAVIAEALNLPYQTVEALREYDCGILEGRADEAAWQVYNEVSEAWMTRQEWERRIPGGESLRDIVERFTPFIAHLLQTHSTERGALLLVAHGGLYRCMLPMILRNISWPFADAHRLDYAEMVIARADVEGLQCERWGDIPLAESDAAGAQP